MKRIGILLSCFALTACGKADLGSTSSSSMACKSLSAVGSWLKTSPSKDVQLTAGCQGSSTYCNEKFTFTPPAADGITLIVTTTQTNGGPECLPMGVSTCTAQVVSNNTQLQVNCGAGIGTYIRQ